MAFSNLFKVSSLNFAFNSALSRNLSIQVHMNSSKSDRITGVRSNIGARKASLRLRESSETGGVNCLVGYFL